MASNIMYNILWLLLLVFIAYPVSWFCAWYVFIVFMIVNVSDCLFYILTIIIIMLLYNIMASYP